MSFSFLKDIDSLIIKDLEEQKKNKDNFNMFEILKLTKAENQTHSAFIAELLNPKGSHNMGELFLVLFLETLGHNEINKFQMNGIQVYTEYHLGFKDDINKKGGRLDILVTNNIGQTICIENKIDAGLQKDQIERYLNYNVDKNYVYLLTLTGTIDVIFDSDSNKYWRQISYYKDIKNWLQQCMMKVQEYSILHESIKQYLHLVNQLTGQLESKQMNEELKSIITKNIVASQQIAMNYEVLLVELKETFRKKVYEALKLIIANENDWEVVLGNSVEQPNSQIWIKYLKSNKKLWIGLEGFSGKGNFYDRLVIGIISIQKVINEKLFKEVVNNNDSKSRNWWYEFAEITDKNNQIINLNNDEFVAKLYNDDFTNELVNVVVMNFNEYFSKRRESIINLLSDQD